MATPRREGAAGLDDLRAMQQALAAMPTPGNAVAGWHQRIVRDAMVEATARIDVAVGASGGPLAARMPLNMLALQAKGRAADLTAAKAASQLDAAIAAVQASFEARATAEPAADADLPTLFSRMDAAVPALETELKWNRGKNDLPQYQAVFAALDELYAVRIGIARDMPQLQPFADRARSTIDAAAADMQRYIDYIAKASSRNEGIFPKHALLGRVRSDMNTLRMVADEELQAAAHEQASTMAPAAI
jgi:hypothetical protein